MKPLAESFRVVHPTKIALSVVHTSNTILIGGVFFNRLSNSESMSFNREGIEANQLTKRTRRVVVGNRMSVYALLKNNMV